MSSIDQMSQYENQHNPTQEDVQLEPVDSKSARKAHLWHYNFSRKRLKTNGNLKRANREDTPPSSKKNDKEDSSLTRPALPLCKLFTFATPYDYLLMTLGTLGGIAHGAALPLACFFLGKLLNGFGAHQNDPQKAYTEVSKFALYFIYVGIVAFISAWAEVACSMETGERQVEKMRIKYVEAMLRQDISFFDTQAKTSDIVNSISTNTVLVQQAISENMGNFIHFISTFFSGFIVGFTLAWRMGLLTLATMPSIAFVGAIYVVGLTTLTSKSHEAYAEAGFIAEQTISHIRIVYSFIGEAKALDSYSKALKSTLKLGYKSGTTKGVGIGAINLVAYGAWAILMWYGGVLVRKAHADGGRVFAAACAVLIGSIALGTSAPNIAVFAKAKSAGYNIMEMIDRKPMTNEETLSGKQLEKVYGEIQLQNVKFSYPARPDMPIFEDFSLTIPAGKTVAIVGSSGCGKSTVISLIERFYDPISGRVLLDGHNIKGLQLRWLREQMGLVNQEPSLFATSIQDNILYGKQSSSSEEIKDAAKAANAHDFVIQLPDGYKTQVGDKGVKLSGGQKQRVAIARAMLRNPAILLLDEATSALDAESEHVVQDALNKIMFGRTTIIVAHRLSTIRNADYIAVLQQGKVVELGRHDDLIIKEDGAYALLVRLQEKAKVQADTESQCVSRGNSPRRKSHDHECPRSYEGQTYIENRQSSPSKQRHSSYDQPSTAPDGNTEKALRANIEMKTTNNSYIWRLMKLNAPEWPYGLMGTIGAVLAGLVNPIYAVIIGQMLRLYYDPDHGHMQREIQKNAIIFAGVAALAFILLVIMHSFFGIIGENLTKRVREMMLAAMLRNEVGWFDREENNSSEMASRLASNAASVRAAVGDRISLIVQNVSLTVAACALALTIHWRLAIVFLPVFPFVVGSEIAENLFLKGFAGDIAKAHNRATMLAGEAVSNIRTVSAFNAQEKVVQLVSQALIGPKRSITLRGHAAGLGYGLAGLLMFWSYGLTLWYGAVLVKDGMGNFGDVTKCFFLIILTAFAVSDTVSFTPDIVKSGQALKSVFEILDRESEINTEHDQGEHVDAVKGYVELKNVEFHYPSRPEVTIFRNLTLNVYSGQSLALVGASGSGKSSVIALIERFYDPVSGHVLIDGKDIRKLNLKSLRKHIGLVQQEPALFASTIYENILFGREDASETETIEAAKAGNAHEFISALPDGYKTHVGERGVQLSGGQKQRVALARAVLKNPAILLLDEATSALDSESELIVQEALDRLMQGRTTLLVAHRLSTVRNANKIAVLEAGTVVEQGTHSDLIGQREGAYSRLIKLQHADT